MQKRRAARCCNAGRAWFAGRSSAPRAGPPALLCEHIAQLQCAHARGGGGSCSVRCLDAQPSLLFEQRAADGHCCASGRQPSRGFSHSLLFPTAQRQTAGGAFSCATNRPTDGMPQRGTAARGSDASVTFGQLALRLDRLPTEVRAGELTCRRAAAPRPTRTAGACRSCRRSRSASPGTPARRLSPSRRSAGAPPAPAGRRGALQERCSATCRTAGGSRTRSSSRFGARWQPAMPPGCGARSGGPVRASARQRSGACGAGAGPAWSRATGTVWPAAGTPAGAGAAHWLQAQGAAVKRVRGLVIGEEAEDAERLSAFLAGLPALVSADGLVLHADLHRRPSAEAIRAFLAGAVRAVGCCASLRTLHLRVVLLRGLAGQVPTALARELAGARALEEVTLTFKAIKAKRRKWPVIPSLAHLVAGLAGLPRLRALGLLVANVGMEATLPADVSRLTALTRLCLSGLRGLCCEPGWARMPELEFLRFGYCEFACDGEAALPGVDALGALTILELYLCSGLHVLPASLWRLTELPYLAHWRGHDDPPAGGLPASAPCYASLLNLCLSEHQLRDWPAGILTMTSLTDLNLHGNCFEQLPEGVSVLTALQVLCV